VISHLGITAARSKKLLDKRFRMKEYRDRWFIILCLIIMDNILSIATRVSTPLALGGFIAAAFFLVVRSIIARRIFPRLAAGDSFGLLTLIVNRLFQLSLLATCLGFVGYLVSVIVPQRQSTAGSLNELKVVRLEASMEANRSGGLYQDAEILADTILQLDGKNAQAYNMKGTAAFYRGDFQSATGYFLRAVELAPKDPIKRSNLANAYVEVGNYDKALEIWGGLADGSEGWHYSMGRASLFAGQYDKAVEHLSVVRDQYWHAAARVLEAAALMGLTARKKDDPRVQKAQSLLSRAVDIDSSYWKPILAGEEPDIHQSWKKPRELLKPLIER